MPLVQGFIDTVVEAAFGVVDCMVGTLVQPCDMAAVGTWGVLDVG